MVHEQIREARLQAGLTQREVSERTGIAEATLRSYEAGRLNPKYETIKNIADAIGVPALKILDPDMYEQHISDLEEHLRKINQSLSSVETVLETGENIGVMGESAWIAARDTLREIQKQVNLQLVGARIENNAFKVEQATSSDKRRSVKRTHAERLFLAFGKLNAKGQKEAVKRVEELGKLPDYAATDKRHMK